MREGEIDTFQQQVTSCGKGLTVVVNSVSLNVACLAMLNLSPVSTG